MNESPAVDRPIFIVGPHRSGTTLLYRILSKHPDLGHLNRGNHRFPAWPRFARLLTRLGSADDPLEAQRFWDYFWDGSDDHMDVSHATPHVTAWYRGRISRILALQKAPRLVSKYPRLSLRLPWLDAVFPGAIFLHMARDWRAVLALTVARKVKRHRREGGWFGVRMPGWKEPDVSSPELTSARIFAYVSRELEKRSADYPGRFHTVWYEDVCSRPVETIRDLTEKCGLPWSAGFMASLPGDLRSANYKWRETLAEETLAEVKAENPELLTRYER